VIKNIRQNSKGNSRKLMMVGDGPEKKSRVLCQELGILDKVMGNKVMRLTKF
jgi:hypothetical protein